MAFREPLISEHAKKVLRWRESFLELDENRFSETMRMYLGEIKTPYNKQNLISSLESFLHQKENLIAIKSFVTPEELEIICATVFIPDCTDEKLNNFFDKTFSFSFLYETLVNLEERLILFRSKNIQNDFIIEFNPLLEDAFYDLIKIEKLLPKIQIEKKSDLKSSISAEFIAAFISFVLENPNLVKHDRTLKKHTIEIANEIFSEKNDALKILFDGFVNLGLLKESNFGYEFDWNKLDKFVTQNFTEQLIYIAVASVGHFSRDELRLKSQLLIDTLFNLDGLCFTKLLFLRTSFLVAARPGIKDEPKKNGLSRFARILGENRASTKIQINDEDQTKLDSIENDSSDFKNQTSSEISEFEKIFDATVALGIISCCETSFNKQDVFQTTKLTSDDAHFLGEKNNLNEMISVDPGMSVNLMPGYALKDILPIVRFMKILRYDTVSTYTINRQSIMRGFDTGLSANTILDLLSKRTLYSVPENLSVQIEDWYALYSSTCVYRGFVLKLQGKSAIAAEHNSVLAQHIHSVIAPGIFLLDVNDDAQAIQLLKDSGLDFVGKIKTVQLENISPDFFKLNLDGKKINERLGFEVPKEKIETCDSKKIKEQMYEALAKLKLNPAQKEELELRIIRKVILNPKQLNPNILHLERTNADAMDFAGKLYIIDLAIKSHEKVEMFFGVDNVFVTGFPISVNKKNDEIYVEIQLEQKNIVREYSVAKATSIRRIKKGIYGR